MIVQNELVYKRQELLVLVSACEFAHDKIVTDTLVELLEISLDEELTVVETKCFLDALNSESESFALDAGKRVRDQRVSDVFLDDAHDRMIQNVPRKIVRKHDVTRLATVNDALRDAIVWLRERQRQDHLLQLTKLVLAISVELAYVEVA